MCEPGSLPHVGGAILPVGCTSVLIHERPAARVGDRSKCNGPADTIAMGEPSVLIADRPAARVGDATSHGGVIVAGCACVQIGRVAQAIVMTEAAKIGAPFCAECARRGAVGPAKVKRPPPPTPPRAPAVAPRASTATPPGPRLGALSRKYECGNRGPATIAHAAGDAGGASYGSYQIATNTGTMRSFLKDLRASRPDWCDRLEAHRPGTAAFDAAWRAIARDDPPGFEGAQHEFIRRTHHEVARGKLAERLPGLDFEARSATLRDVLWSTAVQHGAGGAPTVFARAIGPDDPSTLSDDEIIRRVYRERGADAGRRYFPRCSPDIQASVVRRFRDEQADALAALASERAVR
jgi:uncharacterized Zn-binding protein involved in type VI secretion